MQPMRQALEKKKQKNGDGMTWNKIKIQLDVWSLYYREYIIGFVIGFIIGALVLQNESKVE